MWARKLLDDHWLLALCASTLLLASPAVAENADYSQRLAALINLYRVDHGRAVLSVDAELTRLALDHSVAMAKNRQMSHDGFESRARQSASRLCVENVGWNHRSPDAQLDGWCVAALPVFDDGYHGAVAARGGGWSLVVRRAD